MPPAIAAVAVWAASGTAAFATVFGTTVMGTVIGGAVVGAAVGAGTAAIMGQDVKKGALGGALAGAVVGGVSAYAAGGSWAGGASAANGSGAAITSAPGSSMMNTLGMGKASSQVGFTPMPTGNEIGFTPMPTGNEMSAVAGSGGASSGMSMADAMVQVNAMNNANTTKMMIGQGVSQAAKGLLEPSAEEKARAEVEAARALDESRRIGGLDTITRNLAQGKIIVPEAKGSWESRLEQLKRGGLLAA